MESITIIGLNQIGCSIAMALKQSGEVIHLTGLDRDTRVAARVEKYTIFDKISQVLAESAENADLVFLCIPWDEIQDTMTALKEHLKPGAIILDTSRVLATSTSWAAGLMPPQCSLLTFTPTLNPDALFIELDYQAPPTPNLFNNSLIVLTAAPGTPASAIEKATELARKLGASLWLAEPQEAASMFAAIHLFPQLVAAAGFQTLLSQPSWEDARKLAGINLLNMAAPLAHLEERERWGEGMLLQRDSLNYLMEGLIHNLQHIRALLSTGDQQELGNLLSESQSAFFLWQQQRSEAKWDKSTAPHAPNMGDILKSLVRVGLPKEKK